MHDILPLFSACVTCTFNRFAPSWFLFVLLRFAAVAVIARPRLDVVRTMGILAVFEAPYFYLWKLSIFTWYAEHYHITPLVRFGAYYTGVFDLGIPQALGLMAISRIRYFRNADAPAFQLWRALLVIPLFIGIHFAQALLAFSAYSSTI